MGPLRGEQEVGGKDGHCDVEGHRGESHEWQGQGYKRNCCESCPAKQLKCIIPSWEEREIKQLRSCPAYYKCWAHTAYDLHCPHTWQRDKLHSSDITWKSTQIWISAKFRRFPGLRFHFQPTFTSWNKKENKIWLLRQKVFQGNTDLWLICLASQHKAKPMQTALKKADFFITSTRQTHSHSHFCWNTSYPDSSLPESSPPPPVSPPWPERCSRPGLGSRCVSAGPRWSSEQQPARFPVSPFPAVFPCLWIKKWQFSMHSTCLCPVFRSLSLQRWRKDCTGALHHRENANLMLWRKIKGHGFQGREGPATLKNK